MAAVAAPGTLSFLNECRFFHPTRLLPPNQQVICGFPSSLEPVLFSHFVATGRVFSHQTPLCPRFVVDSLPPWAGLRFLSPGLGAQVFFTKEVLQEAGARVYSSLVSGRRILFICVFLFGSSASPSFDCLFGLSLSPSLSLET